MNIESLSSEIEQRKEPCRYKEGPICGSCPNDYGHQRGRSDGEQKLLFFAKAEIRSIHIFN